MNLEEYKYQKGKDYGDMLDGGMTTVQEVFEEGFDAAIALELPVKFGEFCFNEVEPNLLNGERFYITNSIMFPSTKELYQYWIENVFKIE